MVYSNSIVENAVGGVITIIVLVGLVAYIGTSFTSSHFPSFAIAALVCILCPSALVLMNASMEVILVGWWITCLIVIAVGIFALMEGDGGFVTLILGGFVYVITTIITAGYFEQPWLLALIAIPVIALPFIADR